MGAPKWLDLKEVHRWVTLRCEQCGHRFRWKRDARHSFGNRDGKVYHRYCMSYLALRAKADERLEIIGRMCALTGLNGRDVGAVMGLQASDANQRVANSNLVFRVFYDLERATPSTPTPEEPK